MRRERISSGARRERALREAAVREAGELFDQHGADAIAILSTRLVDVARSAEQRRQDRLALLEAERLDRVRRQGPAGQLPALRQPRLFSRIWFDRLFRRRRRRR